MQQVEREGVTDATGVDSQLVLLATVAVFAIYAWSTWVGTLPRIAWDELGFIAQAQWLSGAPVTINMGTAPYYHAGYSLLLVPVLWFTHDPLVAYKGFMLINAVLAALVVPLLISIGAAFGFRRSLALVLAALLVALWPSSFFVSHYAWSEALFRLVFVANVWALTRLALRPRATWALLFAASGAALYAVHPKALLILLVVPATLIPLRIARVLTTRTLVAALVLLVLLVVAEMLAMDYLHAVLWNDAAYSAGQTLMGRLIRPETLSTAVVVVVGQLWYQLAASLGLAGLGFWFMARYALVPGATALRLTSIYVVVAVLAVAAASVVQMLDPVRVDHIAYGRYIDGASVVLVWLGLCWLVLGVRGEGQRAAGSIAVAIVLVAGGVLAVLPLMDGLEPAHPEAVAGVGWLSGVGSTPLRFFGSSSLLLAVPTLLLLLGNRFAQMSVLVLFVALAGAAIHWHEVQHAEVQLALLTADATAVHNTKLAPLYWSDGARDHSPGSYSLQYALSTAFLDFDGTLPHGAGLVSDQPTGAGLVCAARLSSGLFLLANPPHAGDC